MDVPGFTSAAISSCFLGVASHLLYFIRGEHHLESISIVVMATTLPFFIWVFLIVHHNETLLQAALFTIITWTCFFASLWASILIYRVFFHSLRSFPGPTMAKLTKLWGARNGATFRHFEIADNVHSQYGDFVRTGEGLSPLLGK